MACHGSGTRWSRLIALLVKAEVHTISGYLPLKDCGHALPQSPRRFLGTAFLDGAEECDHVRGADWEAFSSVQQKTLELMREIAAIQDREGDDP